MEEILNEIKNIIDKRLLPSGAYVDETVKIYLDGLHTKISNLVEAPVKPANGDHKCAGCGEIIYYQNYCDNCRRLWES